LSRLAEQLNGMVSMDEIIHALYVNIKFSHGEQEIREGKGISQVEAKKKLEKWLK
jgi:hypothetical protein